MKLICSASKSDSNMLSLRAYVSALLGLNALLVFGRRMERPLTIFDFKHAGGTLIDGFKIVLYGDDGRSVFMVEMREKVIDFVSACAVEPRRRLVEHDEIIVAEQRPCNENALPLTAGKIAESVCLAALMPTEESACSIESLLRMPRMRRQLSSTSSAVIGKDAAAGALICGTYPTPWAEISIRPEVGLSSPRTSLIKVLFPAPFGPTTDQYAPAGISRLR